MLGMFKYGDLSTKIRGMKGKMLSSDDYEQMMLKRNVNEVALYLKNNTYYKDALVNITNSTVHRGQLEVLLYRAVVTDALKIAKHLTGNEKKIYRYIYRKLETEDVKKMLRTLQMGRALSELDRSTLFVSRYSIIDFDISLEATTITALVKSLEGTSFHRILSPLINENGGMDIFTAEMVLDLYYYQKTAKQVKKMTTGKDRELLQELFGLEADFKNIFWILRAKNFYNLSKEMVQRYTIPFHYKIHKDVLYEMIEAPDMETAYKLVDQTYYGKIIDFRQEKVELQFLSYMHKVQQRSMRTEPFTIAPIIGYMYLKELEVLNITNIVEGIRYNVEPDKIHEYLAGVK